MHKIEDSLTCHRRRLSRKFASVLLLLGGRLNSLHTFSSEYICIHEEDGDDDDGGIGINQPFAELSTQTANRD